MRAKNRLSGDFLRALKPGKHCDGAGVRLDVREKVLRRRYCASRRMGGAGNWALAGQNQHVDFPPNRAGRIGPDIPELRQGTCFQSFLEPRRTAEKALTAITQEAYVSGVSTRAVDALIKAMSWGGNGKRPVDGFPYGHRLRQEPG
jgi:hypothetical protein